MTKQTVNITPQQALKSQQLKKEKVKRTIHQQQVYRAAQNLFYVLTQMRKTCPVKFRAVLDTAYSECASLLVALSIAYAEEQARVAQLTIAAAHVDAIRTILGILRSSGCISKDDFKKSKSLVMSCTQQVLAWRASSKMGLSKGSNQQTA